MFSWRRKKNTGRHGDKKRKDHQLEIPRHFLCPVTLDLMKDPVTLSSGITYDRESIETWLEDGNFTCPVTNQPLRSIDQIPNHSLRKMIQDWCVENRNYGVERIPTPRIPVTSEEVIEILFEISDFYRRLDQCGCLDSLHKIKKWCTESERNRRCITSNETAAVLAAAFDAFATDSFERNAQVLEEILCLLNWMFPLSNKEAQLNLGSQPSLHCMVWFLKYRDDLSVKQNSMIVLKELLSCDQRYAQELASIDGVNEMLFKLIKNPICPSITKASLMVIFYIVSSSSNEKIKSEFVEMGLVSLLLETIVESERSICERALGIIDELCDSKQGREAAYNNALAMPVLVKKILRVSEFATEYSVSTIWKLCKYEKKYEERVLIEALQVGAFQKLLLLIQVGCGDSTKEKTTELLKLLNPYRAGLECIDSVDFKSLNRSF